MVMTTRETAESKAEALDAGANAYLLKSAHSHSTLAQTFAMLLEGRASKAA